MFRTWQWYFCKSFSDNTSFVESHNANADFYGK